MLLPFSYTQSTPRFLLRRPLESDVPHIFSATRYAGFNDGMLWEPPEKIEDMKDSVTNSMKPWKSGEGYNFSIANKETGEFLGRISIRQEPEDNHWNIGFWTHPAHQGKGIMTEAGKMIVIYAFEILQLKRLSFNHFLFNNRSKRVCEKLGFIYEGTLRKKFQMYDGA